MIEEKIKTGVQFASDLSQWFDRSLPSAFDDVINRHEEELELYSNEPLLTFDKEDVIVSDQRLKAKIAEVMLENRINDELFTMEYKKSKSMQVIGYG
jgi:hypothetical protein